MPNEDEIQGEWNPPPVGEDILKELRKIQPETYDQEIGNYILDAPRKFRAT